MSPRSVCGRGRRCVARRPSLRVSRRRRSERVERRRRAERGESFPRGRVDAVAAQIACPVVAKITLYTVISGSLTALAFVRSNEDCGGDLNDAFFRLPYLYARAMAKRARQNSMFAVAGLSVAFTWGYLLWSVPHIVGYMSSH